MIPRLTSTRSAKLAISSKAVLSERVATTANPLEIIKVLHSSANQFFKINIKYIIKI